MRILTINEFWGRAAGSEKVATEEHDWFLSQGHSAAFAYGHSLQGEPDPERTRLATCINQPSRPSSSLCDEGHSLLEWALEFAPDVVYLHKCLDLALVAELMRRWPVVWTNHGHQPYCPGGSLTQWRSNRVCPRLPGIGCAAFAYMEGCAPRRPKALSAAIHYSLDALEMAHGMSRIRTVSHYMRDRLVQNGIPAQSITVIPGPIEVPVETVPPGVGILFAGRLSREKGPEYLVRALPLMKNRLPVTIAGDGPQRSELETLASRLGVMDRISFVGWMSPDARDRLMDECSMVVFPSVWPEPYGLVGPEALARGRPVVAFDVGGVRDWLIDGETGCLVPRCDVQALARAVDRLAEEPGLGARMGARGREHVAARNDPSSCYGRLMTLLEEAAGRVTS